MKVLVPGFSMLEFLIYNTLFCFLVFLGTVMITRTCMAIKMQEGQEQAMLDTSLVYDLFARDMHHAPSDKKAWKQISGQAIVWHDARSQSDKGWCWQQHCLYTIEGRYDKEKQQWLSSRKSLVAQHITKAQFMLHEYKADTRQKAGKPALANRVGVLDQEYIKGVSLVISSLKGEEQELYIGIRARKHL